MGVMFSVLSALFIGLSLIGAPQPAMPEQVLHSHDTAAQIGAQAINAAPPIYNRDHAATVKGANAGNVLPDGRFDPVILTEALPLENHIRPGDSAARPAPVPTPQPIAAAEHVTPAPEPQGGVALGLAQVTDWSTQLPFIDLMKTARPWIGHLPNRWGGWEHADLAARGALDPQGWPLAMPRELASIGTLILTDLPREAKSSAGRYVLRFAGKGIVEVTGRASNTRYGKGEVTFDFTPGPGAVDIRIQRTDPQDPVRDITVMQADLVAGYDAGQRFNPDWTALLTGMTALRFMDWMNTNDSDQAHWPDRPLPGDYTWTRTGVPAEILIDLANETGIDPWFTMPHLADDAYVTAFAELVRDRLDPARRAYVEFSNEVWNWQFQQAAWADGQAQARWSARDAWVQYHGMRAAEVARLWSAVLPRERLVNVIATQTGWLGLEDLILDAPLAVAEGALPPASAFDAYAVTGYFGGILGTEDRAPMVREWLADSLAQAEAQAETLPAPQRAAHIAAHRFDLATALAARELTDGSVSGRAEDTLGDLLGRVLPHHAAVAEARNLDLIMYEGGTHLTGIGPMVDDAALTEFFIHFNYTPEMGALYDRLIAGWREIGGGMFNAYCDVYAPTKWGSWGAQRWLGDDNPRWRALRAAR